MKRSLVRPAAGRGLLKSRGMVVALATAISVSLGFIAGTAVGSIEAASDLMLVAPRLALLGLASSLLGIVVYFSFSVFSFNHLVCTILVQRRRYRMLRRRDRRLQKHNILLDTALNNMSQGLSMFDGKEKLVVSNDSYATLYNLSPDQITSGMSLREIVACRAAYGVAPVGATDQYMRQHGTRVARGGTDNRIQELSDGRLMAVSHRQMPDGGWLSIHDDVTEKHHSEIQIAHMTTHDALTGLPNRLQLLHHLQSLEAGARRGHAFSVLYLDLDYFKHVNDTLGHAIGDGLLKAVAARLRECVRATDMIARLGGDEFAVIQTEIGSQVDATILAKRIIEALALPFAVHELQVSVGLSIGIALSPTDGSDPDQLVKKAGLALHRAKDQGRGVWSFFEPEMDARAQQRRNLEIGLRQAIADCQIELHYQPLVDMRGAVCCFEALARWRHPERGLIPPGDFIPVAEETGLIIPLGEQVLRQACAMAVTWPDHIKVAVNLSPAQFKGGNLAAMIVSALTSSGLPAQRLELEITESILMQNHQDVLATLHRLRALGVRFSMDDFGTGYSSLSYLRRFPFDKIKIDRSFIKDITSSNDCVAIVRAVASLGRSLGITITAEGVETIEQLKRVREEGCGEVQGYLISRPLPAEGVDGFLLAHHEAGRSAA
jgi:diguanylate cyclase (GGDEF)-like protein